MHCRVGASSSAGGGRAPFPALILPYSRHREGKGSEMFLHSAPECDTPGAVAFQAQLPSSAGGAGAEEE